MDRIEIVGLHAFGYHGVLPGERQRGQWFVVDLLVEGDVSAAAASDALEDTVDYADLARRVHDAVAETRFGLLEALAGHLADVALAAGDVAAVDVRVAKPDATLAVEVDEVAVRLRRQRGQSDADQHLDAGGRPDDRRESRS